MKKRVTDDEMESLCGILTWVAFVVDRGRPRCNAMYRALKQMHERGERSVRPRGDLLRQMK